MKENFRSPLLSLFFTSLLLIFGCSKSQNAVELDKKSVTAKAMSAQVSKKLSDDGQFKVIGYLMTDGPDLLTKVNQLDLSKITELNVAFINPDSDGDFYYVPPTLEDVATLCHQAGVKMFIAIGGGGAPTFYHDLISPSQRDYFISNITQLAVDYHIDGIDVDLEGALIDANYEKFVVNLGEALHNEGKQMSAAVATWTSSQMTDEALDQFDFINIMSYDATGPWDPSNPGQHAPYSMAVSDLNHWKTVRAIQKYRVNLGVPFYGYSFGSAGSQEYSFKQIANSYPGSVDDDQVNISGGTIYYNGKQTIRDKTDLALDQAGGIMIWELGSDATGTNSLLGVIDDEIGN